ncbi:hypothetical protein HXX76_006991 [Chlamydomonas incerta]|uniref:Glycosyl transferase CAP10 domain-containing protein n=1 Tax=Chlamydomonas incerta TaxID=51695 RepID=A0A835TBF0_CHLIN|nr:hypothetical protein HXX76_006991 [Chlamydomonas incerta]|eukprot:KAG2435795.1 hypothetical protein HXX76_006991 [Chlamydomonas incerta]
MLVLIYNNTIYWPTRPDGPKLTWPTSHWASPYKCDFHAAMTAALASGRITLPNALFIYNTDDNIVRFGRRSRNLTVPSLSISRLSNPPLQPEGEDLDILVPQMMYTLDSVTSYPWHLKKDIAFFRGKPHCTGLWGQRYNYTDACSRAYLAWMSARDEAAGNATALDVAIYIPYKVRHPNGSIPLNFTYPLKGTAPLREHVKYKWLLNLEGMVAAFRLTQFMMLNSLILHQRTQYIEYFYRSLEPWKHFVPFWNATGPDGKLLGMDDVYGVLDLVRRSDRENPAAIQAIIANAQTFAMKFLHTPMRLQYYKAAIEGYKALFPDMDSFLASYVADLRSKGWSI